jgi:hypothetical protein
VVKRGGKTIKRNPLFINLDLEDDTGAIIVAHQSLRLREVGQAVDREDERRRVVHVEVYAQG